MYPFLRLAWQIYRHRASPPLGMFDMHVSNHLCWPWDLDFWAELNNGRTLTLYDLGRMVLGRRTGFFEALRSAGFGLTVAGSSTRYRRRIRGFDRFEMRSRFVGWDARFLYMDQSMWRGETCASQVLIRAAITGPNGIVPPDRIARLMGHDGPPPPLPDWVAAWVAAEARRPWPPEALTADAA